jgi:D-beta-D-heptose 7-phosphate kinase/D-beta-D-heptose 1-phosphate adenosyltransferase
MKRILVIGESCKDIFHYGRCTRLCPEAPAPVFESINIIESGGMAMNVYRNLKQYNVDVSLQTNSNWEYIKKTRFVEKKSNHMFIRLDENDDKYGNIDITTLQLSDYDAIVISDYNKGYITTQQLQYISSSHELTFLDTKKPLGNWCKNFTFIKINGIEYDNTKHLIDEDIRNILIVTQGPDGCLHKNKRYSVPTVEVKDVSGAGDTFLSGLVYKYLSTGNIESSIAFANDRATEVVQKRGVSIA